VAGAPGRVKVAGGYSRTSAGPHPIGRPAAIQASTPPMTSVARRSPTSRRLAAARLELQP
jgi:hypothetical protein